MEKSDIKKFSRFLKENDAFFAFTKEFYKQNQIKIRIKWIEAYARIFITKPTASLIDYCEKIIDKEEVLQYSFLWETSMQGHEFWDNLSMKWRKYCDYLK